MLYQVIFTSLIFGMTHYFKNWVKGHDNILKITVTYISENLFLTKELIRACNSHHFDTKFAYM